MGCYGEFWTAIKSKIGLVSTGRDDTLAEDGITVAFEVMKWRSGWISGRESSTGTVCVM